MLRIDYTRPCQAIIQIAIAVTEPTTSDSNKSGNNVVHVDNASFVVELEGYEHTSLMQQIHNKIEEFKKSWKETS